MSAEAEVSEGLEKPMDNNAQSAEDAKKLLAELEGESATNGANTTERTEDEKPEPTKANDEDKENVQDLKEASPDRRRSHRDHDGDRDGHRGRGRGRGRGGRGGGGGGRFDSGRNYAGNIKSDVTTQEESSDPVAIRKQVEFYFSDGNLPYDKFLLNAVGGNKNNPVPLTTLHSFKRMRHFQPFSAIVDAVKESTFLEVCTDDQGNENCVKRKEPLPVELEEGASPTAVRVFEDKAMPRCIYAKGFGEEKPSTQFDIEAFFAPFGPTNAVRLRRSEDKLFKGSVFVEFENEELAKQFLEQDPKPKFNGKELQIMSKKEYCDKKVDDIKAGRIKPNNRFEEQDRDGRFNRGRGGDRRGVRDRDGWKRKRDDEDDRDWRVRRDEDRRNGFRDNRGRGDRRDRDRDRDRKGSSKVETDESGIPTVKTDTTATTPPKRDTTADKAAALAKAKAVVDEQNKKIAELEADNAAAAAPTVEAKTETNGDGKVESETNGESNKREREEDGTEDGTEREVKKVKEDEGVTAES